MSLLVDDAELARRLTSPSEMERGDEFFTTGLWYLRLCQALFAHRTTQGRLAGRFVGLPQAERQAAFRAVASLPEQVEMLSLRELAPLMAQLRPRHELNLLGLEVVAAAVHTGADVVLSAPSPKVETALDEHGCVVHRIYE